MESGVRSSVQFACYSKNATLQQRTPGVMPRGVRNQKLPPSLYCYSPISSPFNIQNHKNVPCVVSFILDRTAPDSETDGEASLEEALEEENLEDANLVEAEVKVEP
ncbi:hypothetical protein LR48_Vigan04g049000 [Vigna angularis]|uniref:Uncharacterized protein n=1 Tax=Phaseolus angularis TaxID=3914 RepID=A0A0L9UCK6_PHAAN|nr:hypothetical protein LR48_Vigan04g049000 [Vigna angularis]